MFACDATRIYDFIYPLEFQWPLPNPPPPYSLQRRRHSTVTVTFQALCITIPPPPPLTLDPLYFGRGEGCLPRQVVLGMDRKRNVCDRQRFNSRRFRGILPMSDKHTSYDSNKLLSPQLLLSLRKPTNLLYWTFPRSVCFRLLLLQYIYILYIYIFISKIIIFL